MREIQISADQLIKSLFSLPGELNLSLLDSCGVSHLNSHLLVAGIMPIEQIEITETDPAKTLQILDEKITRADLFSIFTISYDFGLKLNRINSKHPKIDEPDIFLGIFDVLIIHDYTSQKTYLTGNKNKFEQIENLLISVTFEIDQKIPESSEVRSNFTRLNYLDAVEKIKEFIRSGDTYQTNLTQQLRVRLSNDLSPEQIFQNLRDSHPAPFASFIRRKKDVVISFSPERFFRVETPESGVTGDYSNSQMITVSPIKGTRPRGADEIEDDQLREELLNSEKDQAENIMIVDLLRNDIGRICEYGSVKVEKLCDLEEHPSLFHLVSTVSGRLRDGVSFSDILLATFPCGSITGAPKIRTMNIIDNLETARRGLSMGAIGYSFPKSKLKASRSYDLSVAIRTMVIRKNEAIFNVGGGIVIDSDPNSEYLETLTKASALAKSLYANLDDIQT